MRGLRVVVEPRVLVAPLASAARRCRVAKAERDPRVGILLALVDVDAPTRLRDVLNGRPLALLSPSPLILRILNVLHAWDAFPVVGVRESRDIADWAAANRR